MAVKVIVELKARSGRRGELRSLIEQIATRDRPSGYHGSTYYASLDDPDLLIDIADWESPEARTMHLEKAMAAGTYGPVLELLAGPFRAMVVRPLALTLPFGTLRRTSDSAFIPHQPRCPRGTTPT